MVPMVTEYRLPLPLYPLKPASPPSRLTWRAMFFHLLSLTPCSFSTSGTWSEM